MARPHRAVQPLPVLPLPTMRHSIPYPLTIASPVDHVGRVVRLEISFRQANLFALCGRWHFIDARDRWMIEDGKPVAARLLNKHE